MATPPDSADMQTNHVLSSSQSALVRRIQETQSVSECLALIPNDDHNEIDLSEDVILAALHVCWKNADLDAAVQLLERHPTEPCRALAISIAGKCGDYQTALKLLKSSISPSIASYRACLVACGKGDAWEQCLELYRKLDVSHRTTLTGNIVLTAMAKSNRGQEALEFFPTVRNPDAQSVLKTMTAVIGMGALDKAYTFVQKYGSNDNLLIDRLVSAYAKANNWSMVRKLNARNGSSTGGTFQPWTVLPKIGKGRTAYWKLGMFTGKDCEITIGLQPNRNPSQNGIKLVLVESGAKIGYLLMKNSDSESALLGVFLDIDQRRRGLSKIFLAVWMRVCLDAEISPNTGVMNKPLLCLTLQHTFGFTPPSDKKGVSVEIAASSTTPDKIIVYSSTAKAIAGAFSPRDHKREGLIFVTTAPNPRGRIVHMKSRLIPPDDLEQKVTSVLLAKGTFDYDRDHPIKTILCGE